MRPPFNAIGAQRIGLAYLAALLRTYGFEAEILDCQTKQEKSIPIPPELSYLREFYPFSEQSPFRLYDGFPRFGIGRDEIQEKIEDSKADYDTIVESNEKKNTVIFGTIPKSPVQGLICWKNYLV